MLTNNDSPSTSQASAEEGISKPVPSFQRSTSNLTPSTTSTPPSLQRHPQSNLESSTVDTLLSDTLSRLDLSANVIISPRPSESSVPTALFKKPNVDPAHAEESDAVIRTGRSTQINRRRSCSDDSTSESESESEQSKDDASTSSSATSVSSVESSSKTAAIPAISARLSTRTISHIVHSILIPLRKKPTLRDFLPILQEVPGRISNNTITCLRDLEKTLIFMAPERAKTANLYLDFCLSSAACIQRVVDQIPERDRTRPTDRLYTFAYFSDLTDQIRQYAAHLAVSKAQIAAGANSSLLAHPTDEIKLYGGMSQNGRPAQLVRVTKDGLTISVETGELLEDENGPIKQETPTRFKRSLSEEAADEEEILRSMARRKKNPTPEELAPKKCEHPGCGKEFKRPCDLTKHTKSHQRRWKCPERDCKYHTYGWPTEKERDRHINDRHSSAPALFKCQFHPCPYSSKRESNCKQHMEKTHGWVYVRTKSNGKKGPEPETPTLPLMGTPGPMGMMQSPNSAQPTPYLQNISTPSSAESMGIATPPQELLQAFNNGHVDLNSYMPDFASMNDNVNLGDDALMQLGLEFPDSLINQPGNLPNVGPLNADMNAHLGHNAMSTPATDLAVTPSSLQSPYDELASASGVDFSLNEDIYAAHASISPFGMNNVNDIFTQHLLQQQQATLQQIQPMGSGMAQQKMLPQTFNLISPMSADELDLYAPGGGFSGHSGYDDINTMMAGQVDFPLYPQNNGTQAPDATWKDLQAQSLFDGLNLPGYTADPHSSQALFEGQVDWNGQGPVMGGGQQ